MKMNRRELLSAAGAFPIVARAQRPAGSGPRPSSPAPAQPVSARVETRWHRSALRKKEITKKVSWPNQEPLVFYLRRGRHDEKWPEIYERQHAPENIKAMADAGVRYSRPHFYKGFGLETEMPENRKTQ